MAKRDTWQSFKGSGVINLSAQVVPIDGTEVTPTFAPSDGYFEAAGLSNSGMRDLAVSPYRYWYLHVDPNRTPVAPTPEMQLGHAIHAAILEPLAFDQRYACEVDVPNGCLVTIDDCRQFLKDKGRTPKGTRKAELVAQVQDYDPAVPILEVIERRHAEANAGKVIFKTEEWLRIGGMARALMDEPRMQEILNEGVAEHSIFVKDPDTGVLLKGKLDFMAPTLTLDFKSFAQKRGKSIDKSVTDAILYEQYYRQAYFYAKLRGWPKDFSGETVMAFVESEPPHEVRLRRLLPKHGGNANLYWTRAILEVRGFIATYKECMEHFGERPWKYAQEVTLLEDAELPGMAY